MTHCGASHHPILHPVCRRETMKGRALAVFLVLVTMATVSLAQDGSGQARAFPRRAFEVGPEIYQHVYREPGHMKEDGLMYGLAASYTEHVYNWIWHAEAEFAYGRVDYDGGLYHEDGSVTPYTYDNISDWLLDTRFLLGPDFMWGDKPASLYTGFGFRLLRDELGSSPYGYDRESRLLYVPFGLMNSLGSVNGWAISTNGEVDVVVYGAQKNVFGEGYIPITNYQHSGFGLRGAISFEKKLANCGMKIQPFYRYWQIAKSDKGSYGTYEPQNNTNEFGLRMLFTF